MEQIKLTKGRLLDVVGNLEQAGYATSLVKDYYRTDIKAKKLRIKEWDYYYFGNQKYGIALTIADNSYMGLASISVMDFERNYYKTQSAITFMPKGKTDLPRTSKVGDVSYIGKKLKIDFQNDGCTRKLTALMNKFDDILDFECSVELFDEPSESMVIATPFDKPKHFYYNQKINCLRVKGSARLGGKIYNFDPSESFAVLDWGRGVWTYKNTWYWSSMSSVIDGVKVGFNLGYGFGDTSQATENMLFYDGKAYKIEQVTFHIPKNNKGQEQYLEPWSFTSNDKTVELKFEPILDRYDNTNLIFLKSTQHQVFGKFSGTLRVNNKTIKINNIVGFAEKVTNKW